MLACLLIKYLSVQVIAVAAKDTYIDLYIISNVTTMPPSKFMHMVLTGTVPAASTPGRHQCRGCAERLRSEPL